MEEPFEVRAHLALHLVDLFEGVEVLSDNAPRLVGVGVVADDFRGDCECGNEETMTARTTSCRETLL